MKGFPNMKKLKCATVAVALVAVGALTVFASGDGLVYDSNSDPLVSLSYINEVVKADYDKKITDLTASLESLAAANMQLSSENASLKAQLEQLSAAVTALQTADTSSEYEIITLNVGQKLVAGGSLELILRSGSAVAYSPNINGINDLTDGTEIMSGGAIPIYHSLVIPRGDGRGITVTTADTYIMVRGDYSIVSE